MKLTRSRFKDLFLLMLGFGSLVGMLFPFIADWWRRALGEQFLSSWFFVLSVGSGLLVGLVNYFLFHTVISAHLTKLGRSMNHAQYDVQHFNNPEELRKDMAEEDSLDAIGRSAAAYNSLLHTFMLSCMDQTFLAEFVRTLNGMTELRTFSTQGVNKLAEYTRAEAALLVLPDAAGKLSVLCSRGLRQFADNVQEENFYQGLVSEIFRDGKPRIFSTRPDLGLRIDAGLCNIVPDTVAVFPLQHHERVVGVVLLAFSAPPDKRFLETLIPTALLLFAGAIQNALVFDKYQRLAAIDDLTGLYTRRFGERRLQEEFIRVQRSKHPLVLAFVDLDHFKRINDIYGHLVGDQALRTFGQHAQSCIRATDIVARYGGEEFFIAMPESDLDSALHVIQRLRKTCAESPVVMENGESLLCTFSVGVAMSDPLKPVAATQELIRRADEALYRAKENGRNRTEIYV